MIDLFKIPSNNDDWVGDLRQFCLNSFRHLSGRSRSRIPPPEIRTAQASLPILIADNVYHCGYHSEKSYAAASYLIQLPTGNVLIDSPRFTPPLVKRIAELGGIKYMYLTHRDDVADHQKFHDRFGCTRVIHQDDVNNDTQVVEEKLTGTETIQWLPDLQIIPVPGHSKGHTALPGHGRRFHASPAKMQESLAQCLAWAQNQ